jgi:hypothetical protein
MAFSSTRFCRLNRLLIDQRYDHVLVNNMSLSSISDMHALKSIIVENENALAVVELPLGDDRVQHVKNVLDLKDGGILLLAFMRLARLYIYICYLLINPALLPPVCPFPHIYQSNSNSNSLSLSLSVSLCLSLSLSILLSVMEIDSIRTGVIDGCLDDESSVRWNLDKKTLDITFKASNLLKTTQQPEHGVDVVLAMPSPRILNRVLPLLASVGVDNIYLVMK